MQPAVHRGLSTARAALSVVRLLAGAPEGVRAEEVARHLDKSASTAYNLLASLCDEGVAERRPGGRYRLAPAFRHLVLQGAPRADALAWVVEDLLARTHKRAYLALVRGGRVEVVLERGHQGMARVAGLDPVLGDNTHALALGKAVLALARPQTVRRYASAGLTGFTAATITEPEALAADLRAVRRTGIASDCEEYAEDLCCMAAPIIDPARRFLGVVGISMTRRAFDEERDALADVLRTVLEPARFQPSGESGAVLGGAPRPAVASRRAPSR